MKTINQLSEKEIATLNQFKEAIKDCSLVDPSDDYILKWLVARNFNMSQAEKMLRLSCEWRKANRISDLLDHWQPPIVLVKYYPMAICGRDKLFCPIWINGFGKTDFKGILQSVSKKDYLRYICYLAETSIDEMRKESRKSGQNISYQTFIIDMENLSMRQMSYKPTREVGFEATKMSEANYPESLRRVFVINAPRVFTTVLMIIKPLLHQATLDKIKVFGTDKAAWKAALLEEIDADQLPVNYGGTMADPNGKFDFDKRQEVPESYYINQEKPVPDKSRMTSLVLSSGSSKEIEFHVERDGSILKWEFMTEEGDLMFKVYYRDDKGEKTDLFPLERVECHLAMEEGEINCSGGRTYVLRFDNSYSYIRSKKVWYRATVDEAAGSDGSIGNLEMTRL